jgi:hypothetical protein
VPAISPVSHLWQTPVRHDHRTGTSQVLGQFEEALKRRIPAQGQIASREGHQRPGAGGPIGRMRRPRQSGGDTRGQRRTRPKFSLCSRWAETPQLARSAVRLLINATGPHR